MKTTSLMSVAVLAGVFGLVTAGWGGSDEIPAQRGSAMTELTLGVSLTTDKAIYAAGERIVIEIVAFNRPADGFTSPASTAYSSSFSSRRSTGCASGRRGASPSGRRFSCGSRF